MKKNRIVLVILLAVVSLLLNVSTVFATAGDAYYNLSEATPASWDGTDGNSLKPVSPDYDYTSGDEESVTYNLPWSFAYYGQSFNRITADTNGNIWFDSRITGQNPTLAGSDYAFDLANSGRGPVIAAWHADLSSTQFGGVFIQHKSSPERVVIEWQTETYNEEGSSAPNSFAVVIFPNGTIRFDYQNFTTLETVDAGSGISRGDDTARINLTTEIGNIYTLAGRSFLFTPGTLYPVTIARYGVGSGSVASSPTGIECGGTCNSSYAPGTSLTLTATPAFGSEFTGWSGACSGTAPCTLTVDAATSVIATFGETYAPVISITSPNGTIGTGQPILNYAVSTGTVVVKVDDVIVGKVSGDTLEALTDGPHVVRVESTNTAGHLGFAESSFIVDTTPATITSLTPATGSSNIPVRMSVLVQFAEPVDPASVTVGMVSLTSTAGPVPISYRFTSDNTSLVVTPQGKLNYAASYTFTLSAGVRDLLGNATISDLTSTFSTPVSDPDLVGYWPMDGDWKDYSVSGNNADAYGSAAFSGGREPGVSSGNFIIDSKVYSGSAGMISAPARFVSSAVDTFTISFWAKPTATRTTTIERNWGVFGTSGQRFAIAPTFIGESVFSAAGAGVSVGTNGVSVFEDTGMDIIESSDGTTGRNIPSTLVYDAPLSGWNHVVIVYNDRQPSLYLNGHYVKTGVVSPMPIVYPSAVFGDMDTGYGAYSGQLGEIAIYKRALTATEINSQYQTAIRQLPGLSITSPGQTVKYKPAETGSATVTLNSPVPVAKLFCSVTGAATGAVLVEVFEPPQNQVTRQLPFQVLADATPYAPYLIACSAQSVDGTIGTAELELLSEDTMPPTVVSSVPANNSFDVSATMPLSVTFSEPLDQSSIVSRSTFRFQRADTGAFVTGLYSLSSDGKTIMILPSSSLEAGTPYTITFSGVKDLVGNALATDYLLHFTTLQQLSLTVDGQGATNAPYLLPAGRYGALTLNNSVVSISGGVTADSVNVSDSTVNVTTGEQGAPGYLNSAYGDIQVTGSQITINGTVSSYGNLNLTRSAVSVTGNTAIGNNLSLNDSSTLTLKKPITVAHDVTLSNNSLLTHFSATTSDTAKLDLTAVNMTIDATSKIDVTGRGYLGGYPPSDTVPEAPGYTLGNTTTGGSNNTNGGSYGGYGGGSQVNAVYGDLANPNELGSGGGGYYYDLFTGLKDVIMRFAGGNGGGLIRLNVANLYLNGSILANGDDSRAAGGSGGSVYINSASLAGSGSIRANGGANTQLLFYNAGGGSGGRIAIYYNQNNSNPSDDILSTTHVSAAGGAGKNGNTDYNGAAGTIYLRDNRQPKPDLIINNSDLVTTKLTPVTGGDFGTVSEGGGAVLSGNYSIGDSMYVKNVQLTLNNALDLPGNLALTDSTLNVSGTLVVPGNLSMDNSNLTLKDTLQVSGAIALQNHSVLSHYVSTTTEQWKLDISAPTITVDATSKIDVSGKGYLGSYQGGNDAISGRTLGNIAGSTKQAGGSYGGLGGVYTYGVSNGGSANSAYGDLTNPNELGSGGSSDSGSDYAGGNGGGLVRIATNNLQLDGSILADGTGTPKNYSYYNWNGSGGSGGGIRIDAGVLTGTGSIYARGGASPLKAGGGGGRIAIYYGSMSLPRANILASGGTGRPENDSNYNGGAGTIYLKASTNGKGEVIVDNGGIAASTTTAVLGGNYQEVSVKGKAVVTMNGSFTTESDMVLTNSTLNVSGTLVVPGNLSMDNSNLTLKDSLQVSGTINLQNHSVLSHYVATTTEQWKLDISAPTITVDATSKIDVSGKGYLGSYQGGNNVISGRTLGNIAGSTKQAGGSYGGLGGVYAGSANGVYGDLTNPNELGSGGSSDSGSDYPGGNGGGLVRITTNNLQLDGSILADGFGTPQNYSYYNWNGSGGSGGGIRIDAGTLSGQGSIYVRGGASPLKGGGGGGRIAIYYGSMSLPLTNILASGGTGRGTQYDGGSGTIYLKENANALTVTKSGTGSGVVQSTPNGIACGTTCTGKFGRTSMVSLGAIPDPGSMFSGWSGACSGSGSCTVTMDAARTVTAAFTIVPPPTVSIISPVDTINNKQPLLQYSVSAGSVVVKLDGSPVSKVSGDTLDPLSEGHHTIRIEASNNGILGFAEQTFVVDTVPPTLVVSALADGGVTNNNLINVAGTVSDNTGVRELQVNDVAVTYNSDGSFSLPVQLNSGPNTIVVKAVDQANSITTNSRTIILDQTAPALTVSAPADNSKTAVALLDVTGTVSEVSTVQVKLGDTIHNAVMSGTTFTAGVSLLPGTNTIEITATDQAGNSSSQKRTVIYDDQKPSLAITAPGQDIRTNQASLLLQGSVSDPYTQVAVTIAVDGQTYAPAVADGRFEQLLFFAEEKTYAIVVTAGNEVGSVTVAQRNVVYDISKPQLTIDQLATPANQTSRTVSGARESGLTISVVCLTASVGTVSYPTDTSWSVVLDGLQSGANTVTVTSVDPAGNSSSATAVITIGANQLPHFSHALFGNKGVTLGHGSRVSVAAGKSDDDHGRHEEEDDDEDRDNDRHRQRGESGAAVGTNSVGLCAVRAGSGARIDGKVEIGPGGSRATTVCLQHGATIAGVETLAAAKEMTPKTDPPGGEPLGGVRLEGRTRTIRSGEYRLGFLELRRGGRLILNGRVTLHIDGDVFIDGGSKLEVTNGQAVIYLNGKSFKLEGGVVANRSGTARDLVIHGTGALRTVNFSGGGDLRLLLYAPTAAVKIGDGLRIDGAIIADRADLGEGAAVRFAAE